MSIQVNNGFNNLTHGQFCLNCIILYIFFAYLQKETLLKQMLFCTLEQLPSWQVFRSRLCSSLLLSVHFLHLKEVFYWFFRDVFVHCLTTISAQHFSFYKSFVVVPFKKTLFVCAVLIFLTFCSSANLCSKFLKALAGTQQRRILVVIDKNQTLFLKQNF